MSKFHSNYLLAMKGMLGCTYTPQTTARIANNPNNVIYNFTHNIIQLSYHVGCSQKYVIQGARFRPNGYLS